jgi:hypothetical protein
MKRIAISQSNYVPWKGYFDMISRVDEFILYDDMQFTRRDWRNRNQIRTAQGVHWLTIPVTSKNKYFELIKNIQISDPSWAEKHWKTIHLSYRRAPYFAQFSPAIESMYALASKEELLSKINYIFINGLNGLLGINTPLKWSMDYESGVGKTERLISLCMQSSATNYLSGPSAKNYIENEAFKTAGVTLEWMDYSRYPVYAQRFSGEFVHEVSVLDVIFNCGDQAPSMVWKHSVDT